VTAAERTDAMRAAMTADDPAAATDIALGEARNLLAAIAIALPSSARPGATWADHGEAVRVRDALRELAEFVIGPAV
jgi:hypothetical protein